MDHIFSIALIKAARIGLPASQVVLFTMYCLSRFYGGAQAQERLSPVGQQQRIFSEYKLTTDKCYKHIPGRGASKEILAKAIMDAIECIRPVTAETQRKLNALRASTSQQEIIVDLSSYGYAMAGRTNINSDHFLGCELVFGGQIPLEDGDMFLCDGGVPSSAWGAAWPGLSHPRVLIFKSVSSGARGLLVEGVFLVGSLIRTP